MSAESNDVNAPRPAPAAPDPQQEHDEAVHWLLLLRLTGAAVESASPQFEAAWERDRQELLDAIARGETSPGGTTEDIIRRAALLTEVEYAVDRKWIADAADITVAELDRFVAERRPKPEARAINNVIATIADVEPWPDPVDGAALLDEVAATLRRFIVFEQESYADVIAVWALGTHLYQIFKIFPRLGVTSPESQCGKTTVLDCLSLLTARAKLCANLTPPVVFRIIELCQPTLLIDELDTFIDKYPELDGVFNSGHQDGSPVMRIVKIDEEFVPCNFKTFAPLAYGRIGLPKGTLSTRSLRIPMLRKDPGQKTEDFDVMERPEQAALLDRLKRQLARWCADNRERVREMKPDTASLANRARDNWRPLLKITSVVGSGWLDRMYRAAGQEPPDSSQDESDAIRLLRDVRNIFHTRQGIDQLPSRVLVADLLLQRESGWVHYVNERDPLTERGLARLLRNFGITSKALSLSSEQLRLFKIEKRLVKGYHLKHFQSMFAKFLANEETEEVEVTKA